jgi:regulator of protease activity HflC (stomatin/prohibitin superfamily)
MLNIGFFKGQPTEYIIKYGSGRIGKEGQGLAFYYWKHNTQIVVVPTSSMDANLVFNEVTSNFQDVTIQGQFTYRIRNPKQASSLLNFSIDPAKRTYVSNDPERLGRRITNIIQMATRGELQKRSLEDVLGQYEVIAALVQKQIQEGPLLESLGVELLNVYFVSAKPTPEVAKALEAGYRETLLRKADEAIYARRASAVEEERKIKENELNTDIALEQQRRQLIGLAGENALQEADNRGKAMEREAEYSAKAKQMELAVYSGLEPRSIVALAMNELGQNAARVGNLTITTELLASLLDGDRPRRPPPPPRPE